MTIRKNQQGRWMIDVKIRMPDGTLARIRKVSPVPTKRGAEQYEREVRTAARMVGQVDPRAWPRRRALAWAVDLSPPLAGQEHDARDMA